MLLHPTILFYLFFWFRILLFLLYWSQNHSSPECYDEPPFFVQYIFEPNPKLLNFLRKVLYHHVNLFGYFFLFPLELSMVCIQLAENLLALISNYTKTSAFHNNLYIQTHIFHLFSDFLRFVKFDLFYLVVFGHVLFYPNVFAPFYEEALARYRYYIIPGLTFPL